MTCLPHTSLRHLSTMWPATFVRKFNSIEVILTWIYTTGLRKKLLLPTILTEYLTKQNLQSMTL